MKISSTTIVTVLAAIASNAAAGAAITTVTGSPRPLHIFALAGMVSNALTLGAGMAMGGLRSPNTVGRGLLWAGAIGLGLSVYEWALGENTEPKAV